jgi:hypothetical protein
MLKFNISTEPRKYFHQLIEILKIFSPFDKLRKRERDVFGEMLYQLYLINQNGGREKDLFDYTVKENIATVLKISKANLYNIYKELRQHKLLTKDEISKEFRFDYLEHEEITFKFRGGNNSN